MLYSYVPALTLILNLILNWELLGKYGVYAKKQDLEKQLHVSYNWFLLAANCYFIVDMTWGVLYDHRNSQVVFPLIYILTVLYYMFMLLTMLTWTRYIVAYIDKVGRRGHALLYGVWVMFAIGVLCLVFNRYYRFVFSYNEANEFVGENGRYVAFILQILFYIIVSVYMLYLAHNSVGRQKIRFKAVALTSMVLGLFLIFQIAYAFLPSYAMGLMIGIGLVHSFVQSGEKKEKEIHDRIASTMAEDYEAIFYIDIESGEYLTFSQSKKYISLNATALGKNFFKESLYYIEKIVYPEDQEYAKSFFDKETMLKNIEGKRSFSFKYRIMVEGKPRFFLFTVMRENNGQYLIFYEKDIEDELEAEKNQKENQKKTITFGRIAESLASNYDEIYYVDIADSSYVCYQVNNIYGQLEINKTGGDFYGETFSNIPQVVHKQDRDQVIEFLNRDNMISRMENRRGCSINYRIMVNGRARYARMTVRKSSDGTHFIIAVENVNDEIQKEKQHLKELNTEKELARRDELTGVKNMTAYKELEVSVQGNIDHGMDYLNFALVVCDTNNLKHINDTLGHAAGDGYIRASARLLCDIFVHSPVFRVGGDEFVVFLRGSDYSARYELMDKLRSQILENKRMNAGVILASGMAEYKPESDNLFSEIFDRADKEMYEDKQKLKSEHD
jgi:diguanylate cyclase (GGDEF)-like protein